MLSVQRAAVLLSIATLVAAQYGGGYGGGSGNGGSSSSGNPNGGNGNFGAAAAPNLADIVRSEQGKIIAHGVLAALAFVIFFPAGAILVRLGNFPGVWLVHAAFQAFAYLLFIAAFGIGVWIATNARVLNRAHPIIGIVIFVLIFFQPFLGLAHHFMFKKHSRRVVWSYGHIWLGRILITLGMINGGLGLQLAQRGRLFAPSNGAIIAYGVIAGVIWVVYVATAIFGEIRRKKQQPAKEPAYAETSMNGHEQKPTHTYA